MVTIICNLCFCARAMQSPLKKYFPNAHIVQPFFIFDWQGRKTTFHGFCKQAGTNTDDFSRCRVQRRIMHAAAWRAGLENKPANLFLLQLRYFFFNPAHKRFGPVLTALDRNQSGGQGFADQLHRLPRHGKTCPNLRAHRNPFSVLSQRVCHMAVEFMPAVIADSLSEETGAYDDFYFLLHRSNKNALSNFPSGRILTSSSEHAELRCSSVPLCQPFLETGALVLCPVPLAIAADGHVLAAGSKPFGFTRGCLFLHFRASRAIYTADPGHALISNSSTLTPR
jgi:hypothetical protein